MRICVLGINYWPDLTGIAPYTTGRAEYLASRGHEVSVLTGFPYYPEWRISREYRRRVFTAERRNGVDIFRSWLHVPRHVTGAQRIFHEASFIVSSLLRAIGTRYRPDILFVVSPPLGLGLSGCILGKLWKVPYIFHVADLQPDAAFDLGMLRSGNLTRTLFAVERTAYRNAVAVSTLTKAIQERIVTKGVSAEKVILLPDWTEPPLFEIPVTGGGSVFRKEWGLEGRFLVVHAGNMGVKQGLNVVLDAAELSRDCPEIAYVLVGDGARRAALERDAKVRGLSNVRFIPLLSTEMFREMLGAADVSLVTQKREVGDIVFPSKVLTLLAAARPVIASVSRGSEIARIVTESGAGVQVEAENPSALLHAIETMRADAHGRERFGLNGRAYTREHWDRTRVLQAFEKELRRVAEKASGKMATSREADMLIGK